MPRRPHGGVKPPTPRPGGSPQGWTFWSTAAYCWRKWFLRYVLGLIPVHSDEFFAFGTTYHAFHEGVPPLDIAQWGPEYEAQMQVTKILYERRLDTTKSPPLPPAVHKERTYSIPIGDTMGITTKPDQEEINPDGKLIPRDFKTAAMFHKYDSEDYATSGQIIAEMVALNAPTGVVDIIHKGSGDPTSPSFGKVQQLQISNTEEKRQALFDLIEDLQAQLDGRLKRAAKKVAKDPRAAIAAFPKNLNCVSKYGLCPYYDRCWTDGVAKYRYREDATPDRWLKDSAVFDRRSAVAKLKAVLGKLL